MATVRYTGGGRYRVGGVTFEPGGTHDVSDSVAEYLVDDNSDFEYANATDVEFSEVDEAESGVGELGTLGTQTDEDTCGTVMSDDSVCDRPADSCPYHGDD